MIRRPPRSTHCISSAASDVYKRQIIGKIVILEQKLFYKEVQKDEEMSKEERIKWINGNYNFDCPEAIDWELFGKTLDTLIEGNSCKVPTLGEETKLR
eukprot:TRINITY_DN6666_c0_g3_i2.p1 TRINITY_DN6666_c0_g3~~TRINITY_DN6666_c0_g3_i2.p1  ORF type:complete len:105 (-),score=47.64 TRINITY_DN6666_c0_g3_i2:592-885(-)